MGAQGRKADRSRGGKPGRTSVRVAAGSRRGLARGSPASTVGAGRRVAAIVLAAGKGTRMNSARAKMLHEVLGVPLVSYPVARALAMGASPVVVVLGPERAEIQRVLEARHGAGTLKVVEQTAARGTGEAARLALRALGRRDGVVLILVGDAPLVETRTLARLLATVRRTGGLALLSAVADDPAGYGRVVRDARGKVVKVVEHRDASREERGIREVNAAIYAAPAAFLRRAVARLRADNAQREYYLPDIVAQASRTIGAVAVEVAATEVAGINDRKQLAAAERVLGRRLIEAHQAHATFRDPDSTRIEADVVVAADVEIGRGVSLRGRTRIGRGAQVEDGSIVVDSEIGEGARVLPYCVIEGAVVGPDARVGPFARLRPGTRLGPGAHVGNFVETKKAVLGRGSKANHLTYLGDAVIGEGVNVGAGTITCNYDGVSKFETVIEDGAFIGSDTQLVAPVRVGRRAVVAAGTTVTEDVPEDGLAIARVAQKNVAGYALRLATRRAARAQRRRDD